MSNSSEPAPVQNPGRRVLGKLIPLLIVFAGVCAVVLVAAVVPKRSDEKPPTEPPVVNVKVLVIEPQARMADTFDLPGVVEPNRVVSVAAEVDGRIERVLIEEGQGVKQDQKIIVLNTDLLQAEHDRAKAQWEFDQREAKRILDAAGRRVATAMELDQARTRLSVSQAQYAAAKARLSRATIRAPIPGVLDDRPVEEGEYVKSGEKVAEIVDLTKAKVVVDVPERDVPYLRVGQAEQIFLDGRSLTGTITFISEQADPAARTTKVEITVKNPRRELPGGEVVRDLRSGRIVRVRLTRRTLTNVIMIPLEAVIPQENEKTVYVVEDGKARRRAVELGFMKGWDVHVSRGLSAGNRLIVSGHRFLAPGQLVREQKSVAAAAASVSADAGAAPASDEGGK